MIRNYSNREKAEEAAREVAQRIRVYARLVAAEKMTKEKADRQIEIMKQIEVDYAVLADFDESQDRLL